MPTNVRLGHWWYLMNDVAKDLDLVRGEIVRAPRIIRNSRRNSVDAKCFRICQGEPVARESANIRPGCPNHWHPSSPELHSPSFSVTDVCRRPVGIILPFQSLAVGKTFIDFTVGYCIDSRRIISWTMFASNRQRGEPCPKRAGNTGNSRLPNQVSVVIPPISWMRAADSYATSGRHAG